MRFDKKNHWEEGEVNRVQALDEELDADALSDEEYGFELGYYSDY